VVLAPVEVDHHGSGLKYCIEKQGNILVFCFYNRDQHDQFFKCNMKLVFATNNRHKFEEIQHVIDQKIELISLNDLGFTGDIPEEQNTLEGNAAQKAFFIYEKFKLDCFADDTGLEIEALSGEPGVFSARYAGESCNSDNNVRKVLLKMEGKKNRKARFRTVIALVTGGRLTTFDGEIKGNITVEKHGNQGFGYDPIFIPEGFAKTFAEMTLAEKNTISHRALAINAFIRYINTHAEKL
jgi:XTP/dITP diphosphohydrolase